MPVLLVVFLAFASGADAQPELPLVDAVPFEAAKANVAAVLGKLKDLGAPLSEETAEKVRAALAVGDVESLLAVQRQLDPHCLVGVTINPESRVKAARGPARATLKQGKPSYFLIKVQNDAGVTQALALTSPQLITQDGRKSAERWLEAAVVPTSPAAARLNGRELEYVIVRLRTEQTGKREANLIFDVGQGTQDLGFRAEVPILFTIE
jgi:hypothetical protein